MSLFYGVLDPTTSSLLYLSAGHEPGILTRASSTSIEILTNSACPMGITPDIEAGEPETCVMNPGDVLFLCTDGVPETQGNNNEMFGRDRLGTLIAGLTDRSPDSIIDAVYAEVREFRGDAPQRDDLTMVVVKAT